MSACKNKTMAIRDAFKKAVRSAGKAFMLDADDALVARLYRIEPRVLYHRSPDDDTDYDDAPVITELSVKLTDDHDSFDLTFDGARELAQHLIEMLDKLDTMEDKYLTALEKVSKDKVEAFKEAEKTFEF